MSEIPVPTDPEPVVDGRRLGARWLAGFMAFFWAVVWYGLIDLSVGVQPDAEFQKVYFLDLGWGLLFTVLLSVPLVGLAVRVEAPALVWQVLVIGMAMVVTGLTAGYPGQSACSELPWSSEPEQESHIWQEFTCGRLATWRADVWPCWHSLWSSHPSHLPMPPT